MSRRLAFSLLKRAGAEVAGTSEARLVVGASQDTTARSTKIAVSGAISAQAAGVMRRIIGRAAAGEMTVTAETGRGATMIATPGRTAVVRPRLALRPQPVVPSPGRATKGGRRSSRRSD